MVVNASHLMCAVALLVGVGTHAINVGVFNYGLRSHAHISLQYHDVMQLFAVLPVRTVESVSVLDSVNVRQAGVVRDVKRVCAMEFSE